MKAAKFDEINSMCHESYNFNKVAHGTELLIAFDVIYERM